MKRKSITIHRFVLPSSPGVFRPCLDHPRLLLPTNSVRALKGESITFSELTLQWDAVKCVNETLTDGRPSRKRHFLSWFHWQLASVVYCFSLYRLNIWVLIRNTADKIQIQEKKKRTQNTKHNDENSLKLKQMRLNSTHPHTPS